ncbi:hypothetical protein [Parasitella parasitica]|uniref:Uncharacterized protein n=1 Tax=Parasitella parasitica TaxID=35722 RepID=A0A0B7NQW9_9FUNG|nr:hypothetical protein [Parasitella parasitica]
MCYTCTCNSIYGYNKKIEEKIARLKAPHDDAGEQLISYHIPHFLETWKPSKKKLSQSSEAKAPEPVRSVTVGDDVPNYFLDSNGRFSEQLLSYYESNLTEKAYGDIIKSRSHNTSITYGYKQLEFLFFFK